MNYKRLVGYLAIVSVLLASCSKKTTTGVEDVKYTGAKMVSFNNYSGFQSKAIPVVDSFVGIDYEIKLANTTGTANAPISVTLIKDDNAINEYNTLNGTSLKPVPVNAYRFEQKTVTISKGARTAKVHFEINPVRLSGMTSPAFGISIYSVSGDGAIIHNSEAQTSIVVEIIAINQWDGLYSFRARTVHPTNGTLAGPVGPYADLELITTGPNTVVWGETHPWANGSSSATPAGYEPTFRINPVTNAVTVENTVAAAENVPGANSRYDPATKTFYVAWRYNGSGGYREFYDTLRYTGPR